MTWWLKLIAGAILLVVLLGIAANFVAPLLLDRIYYRGPVSDHFDGRRFFNPSDRARAQATRRFSPWRFVRFAAGMDRAPWPDHVAVTQTIPPPRVEGRAMRVTWIGHSTVLVQTQGLNILTDPIWSERASPLSFLGPKRVRAPGVAFEHLPKIDLILVSHNHYDHCDIPTLKRLWARDRPLIVVPLGTDTLLRWHGIPSVARDWGQRVPVRPGIDVILERVHHWTSRFGADRNRALWSGFTVTLPGGNLFFAGDTGWGDGSWVTQAAQDGPYRLALIPIGAFRPRELMQASHVGPIEATEIFRRLGARSALAIHWGTFQLSAEAFAEPPERLAEALTVDRIPAGRFRATEPGEEWVVPQ